MSTPITREEVAASIEHGDATLVEALPASHHQDAHLPGAINLPHDAVDELAGDLLPDKDARIVVYCSDASCPNSTIAAQRLTELGYTNVFDYEAGKKDWAAAGLTIESGRPARTGGRA